MCVNVLTLISIDILEAFTEVCGRTDCGVDHRVPNRTYPAVTQFRPREAIGQIRENLRRQGRLAEQGGDGCELLLVLRDVTG